MKFKRSRDERIRSALVSVYRKREEADLGNEWQGRVMATIRRLGIPAQKQGYQEYFERLFWRLAPVAAMLILVLATGILQFDFFSDFELANMFIGESADFSLLPFLES